MQNHDLGKRRIKFRQSCFAFPQMFWSGIDMNIAMKQINEYISFVLLFLTALAYTYCFCAVNENEIFFYLRTCNGSVLLRSTGL